ncbi:tautomerase family protein [Leucobacter sp. GX24907]
MPHIALTMYQGRDEETKRDIAQKIETFYRETFGFGENEVSVSIIDSAPEEYSAAVEGRFTEQEQLVIPSKFIGGQA